MRTTTTTVTKTLLTTTITTTPTATTHEKRLNAITTVKLDKVKKEGKCKNNNFQFAFDSLK